MGFWLYFVFPLLLSLVSIVLTRWQKFFKYSRLLKVIAALLVLVALIFAGFVVFYGLKNNISDSNEIYLSMLVVLIAYVFLVILIKP